MSIDAMPLPESLLKEFDVAPMDLARYLNVSGQAVRYWMNGRNEVSTSHAKYIEDKYGIPRWRMRPDVWDPPEQPATASAATPVT